MVMMMMMMMMMSRSGWMLAPVVFGKLIDGICIQWEDSCTGTGACRLYDNDVFRYKFISCEASFSFACFLCLLLALIAAKIKKNIDGNDRAENGEFVCNSDDAREETML
nr:hypothetical protein BaRGS_003721 [Batillaria attramentaria]